MSTKGAIELTPYRAMILLLYCELELAILKKDHEIIKIIKERYEEKYGDFDKIFSECERSLMKRKNPEKELEQLINILREYLKEHDSSK